MSTRKFLNLNAFDSNISPKSTGKLIDRISPYKLTTYEKFIRDTKNKQFSKNKSLFFNDKQANNISTHLKNQCVISKLLKLNENDGISDYDKVEVIDLT